MVWNRENIQRATVVLRKMPCWYQRSEESRQVGSRWKKSNSNSNNHLLKPRYTETAADDHTGCDSCQLRTGNWNHSFYRLTCVQAGGGGVRMRGMFSNSLCPFVTTEHCLNSPPYLSIATDHVHPFMNTGCWFSDGFFPQDTAPCHRADISSNWFLEHDSLLSLLSSTDCHSQQTSIQ